MAARIPAPLHRKRWRHQHEDAPLPIPIASLTAVTASDDNWCCCTGRFQGDCVLVTDLHEMTMLYNNGFFGKGTLSKCGPGTDRFKASEKRHHQPSLSSTLFQCRKRARVEVEPTSAVDNSTMVAETSQCEQLDQFDPLWSGQNDTDQHRTGAGNNTEDSQDPATQDWPGGDSSCWELSEDRTAHGQPDQPYSQLMGAAATIQSSQRTTCAHVESTTQRKDLEECFASGRPGSSKGTTEQKCETGHTETGVSDTEHGQENYGVRPKDCANQEDKISGSEDQSRVGEFLQLSLEEAFFLSYGLGCLSVLDGSGRPMTLVEMWQRFSQTQHDFIQNYIVYHYLRSKGWVPRAGVKYGAPWVLYRKGPRFYHSSYSVVVQTVDGDRLTPSRGLSCCRSWHLLAGMDRITQHVGKEVLLCFVVRPADLTEEEETSPSCISRFRVQEVVMKRWVSSQEREEREEDH
ncbi:PREDICTED: tRNA-splicing endonuclease subunit Sen2-like [Branchiostoma belcheri]|uniref:tRNA-splicing endonuclease subunit Sen2 n=1 Tax=Branchiostoma belcheri TaxID=7741 RepID=A0A6P4YCS0_BRABE|nr:PREDICTED: tRNA-splicing endonuclease subunit Sen2-like [Branchiostoma belcheri]XP_019614706.1 PREDICTED: tRNA-splicing endonuclease subunit Sen2-like [Branchiostoma belcheri]